MIIQSTIVKHIHTSPSKELCAKNAAELIYCIKLTSVMVSLLHQGLAGHSQCHKMPFSTSFHGVCPVCLAYVPGLCSFNPLSIDPGNRTM